MGEWKWLGLGVFSMGPPFGVKWFSPKFGEKSGGGRKLMRNSKTALPIFNLQPLLFIYFLYSIFFSLYYGHRSTIIQFTFFFFSTKQKFFFFFLRDLQKRFLSLHFSTPQPWEKSKFSSILPFFHPLIFYPSAFLTSQPNRPLLRVTLALVTLHIILHSLTYYCTVLWKFSGHPLLW